MAMDQLVGRAEELAYLRARLADAGAGAGHLVVLTGPAGIGKTRLVEEVVATVDTVVGWRAAEDAVAATFPANTAVVDALTRWFLQRTGS
jgi:ATP/maltotriose-dependent transcriptional regulator MalT